MLFTFLVFAISTQFRLNWATDYYQMIFGEGGESVDLARHIEEGDLGRRIAMPLLALFGIDTLIRLRKRLGFPHNILGHLIIFFLFWSTISISWSPSPMLTLRKVGILWFMGIGAAATAERLSMMDVIRMTVWITGITLLISLGAEIYHGTLNIFYDKYRFTGVMDPVSQGWNCGLLFLSSLFMGCVDSKHRRHFLIIMGLSAIFLVITKSRMSLASTLLASLVLISYQFSLRSRLLVLSWFGILLGICMLWLTDTLVDIPQYIIQMGRQVDGSSNLATLTGRTELWKQLLLIAFDRPVLGYGYNTFQINEIVFQLARAGSWVPAHSHSAFIQALLGLGMPGLMLFSILVLAAIRSAQKLARQWMPYVFALSFLTWLLANSFLETALVTDSIYPCFVGYVLFIKLGFSKNEITKEHSEINDNLP